MSFCIRIATKLSLLETWTCSSFFRVYLSSFFPSLVQSDGWTVVFVVCSPPCPSHSLYFLSQRPTWRLPSSWDAVLLHGFVLSALPTWYVLRSRFCQEIFDPHFFPMLPKMSILHINFYQGETPVALKIQSCRRSHDLTSTGKISSGRASGQMSFSTAFLDHLEECPEMVHVCQCSVVSDGLPHRPRTSPPAQHTGWRYWN